MGAWSSLPAGASSSGCSVALIRVANFRRVGRTYGTSLPTAVESVERSRPPHSNLDSVHQGPHQVGLQAIMQNTWQGVAQRIKPVRVKPHIHVLLPTVLRGPAPFQQPGP